MNIFQLYIDYMKDNPNHYWFKRKLYGWGWTPVTWQGWLTILVFIILITIDAFMLDSNPEPTAWQTSMFFIKVALDVIILLLICYKTGEAPKWQWGPPKK